MGEKKRGKWINVFLFSLLIIVLSGIILAENYFSIGGESIINKNSEQKSTLEKNLFENNLLGEIPEEEIHGYIIQFKDEPILIKKVELEKEEKKGSMTKLEVSSELENYKEEVLATHKLFKEEFKKEKSESKILGEYDSVFNGIALDITKEEALALKNKFDFIKELYPNYPVHALLQDSVPLINADDVWKLKNAGGVNLTGLGIKVAIIDTGIDYTHPDLGGCFGTGCRVVGGWDFVNNDANPMDDHGHGTHCAGIVGANGKIKGVAPNVTLMAYKVLNSAGNGYSEEIIDAIENATLAGTDIISMSLGNDEGDPDDATSQAVDNAVESGVVVVVAAGNSGSNNMTISSPGCARKVITVGASDKGDNLQSYSSRGPTLMGILKPDVVAPGGDVNESCESCNSGCCRYPQGINSTINDATFWDCWGTNCGCSAGGKLYMKMSGTSMATPHVAGTVALILQNHSDWTPDEIKMALRNTAIDLGYAPNIQGYGRIDALAAVQLANAPPIALFNDTNYHYYIFDKVIINITGSASGDYFSNYTLDVGSGLDPSSWTQIKYSTSQVLNGLLLSDWWIPPEYSGWYSILLKVKDNRGQVSEDRLIFYVGPKGYLRDPTNNSLFGKQTDTGGIIPIYGFAGGENYSNYNISYKEIGTSNWIPLNFSNKTIINGLLANWNVSLLNSSSYYINYTINYSGTFKTDVITVHLDKTLLAGWPKKITEEDKTMLINFPKKDSDETYPKTMVIGDWNNDGLKELLIQTYNNWMYVLNSSGMNVSGWPKKLGNHEMPFFSDYPAALGDINNDEKLEYGFREHIPWGYSSFEDNRLFLIDSYGNNLSGWPNISLGMAALVLDNLSNNDFLEVIMGPHVYFYNGTEVPGSPVINCDYCFSYFGSAIADLDNDGDKEIVTTDAQDPSNLNISVWSPAEGYLSGWPQKTFERDADVVEVSLGDLDGDGDLEIVVPEKSTGKIHALHHNGTNVSGWPVSGIVFYHNLPAALADLDKDGKAEVIVSTGYCQIRIFYGNGTSFPGWGSGCQVESQYYTYAPVIGDVNGDNEEDIIVEAQACSPYNLGACPLNSVQGKIYAFYKNGTIISGWPKNIPPFSYYSDLTNWKTDFAPTITDFNNDGKSEIILNTANTIFVWELNVTYNEKYLSWPKFGHDNRNTGTLIIPDATPPTYNSASHNSTTANQICKFSVNVNDNSALNPNGQYIFSTNNFAGPKDVWKPNLIVNNSLPDIGYNSKPSIFYKDSSWYLISGNSLGTFNGYVWNGTGWLINTTINNSLPDIGTNSTPSVFYKDSSWYLISGESSGRFYGYVWNGTQWKVNTTINNSLPDIGSSSAPSVFNTSSWFILSGASDGKFYCYVWTGSSWFINTALNASLPDIGSYSTPNVFTKDSTLSLISGASDGKFYGYTYAGYWSKNLTINASLPDIGSYSTPSVFYKDSIRYLISGENYGTFKGFEYAGLNWVNDSAVNFTATPSWANITKTLTSTTGMTVGYRWYFKDNLGNMNSTSIYELTTT